MNAILLGLLIPAAGWTSADRSVEAMATGGAGAARTTDPGANVYNAAAGMRTPGLAASAGLILAAPQLGVEGNGFSADTNRGISTPPVLHLAWAGDTFGVGASFSVPFGSRVSWPAEWAGRYDLIEARVQVLRTELSVGGQYGPVAFAAGAFFDVGKLGVVKAIDFVESEGSTSIETTATGFGGQASVYWQAMESLGFGLSYQSRSQLDFAGWADFDVPPELMPRARDQRVSSSVTLPDRFRLGALYQVTDQVQITADLELVLWGTIDQLTFDFENDDMDDQVQPRDWKTTVTPRVGAAWQVVDFLQLRGGLFVDPTPVPSATVGPSSPDSTRVGLSAGAGANIYGGFGVDVAYQLLVFTGRDAESDVMGPVRYSGLAHLVGASLRLTL